MPYNSSNNQDKRGFRRGPISYDIDPNKSLHETIREIGALSLPVIVNKEDGHVRINGTVDMDFFILGMQMLADVARQHSARREAVLVTY